MDGHELALQSLVGYLFVWALEKAKASPKLSFITSQTARLNRLLSVLASLLIAGGFTWRLTEMSGNGFDLVIHIPALAQLAHFAVSTGWQLLNHEIQYQSLFNRKPTA
jgi:hypothetical protein